MAERALVPEMTTPRDAGEASRYLKVTITDINRLGDLPICYLQWLGAPHLLCRGL
jgi:hypothetical protein